MASNAQKTGKSGVATDVAPRRRFPTRRVATANASLTWAEREEEGKAASGDRGSAGKRAEQKGGKQQDEKRMQKKVKTGHVTKKSGANDNGKHLAPQVDPKHTQKCRAGFLRFYEMEHDKDVAVSTLFGEVPSSRMKRLLSATRTMFQLAKVVTEPSKVTQLHGKLCKWEVQFAIKEDFTWRLPTVGCFTCFPSSSGIVLLPLASLSSMLTMSTLHSVRISVA